MSNIPKLPDLGSFFGDSGGGPNLALPQSEAFPNCPFLDKDTGEFCALDGNMCPFVGFNYRRCKKYLNNMAKGMSNQAATGNPVPMGSNQPPRVSGSIRPQRHPRVESLFEVAKKRGSTKSERAKKVAVKKQHDLRKVKMDKRAVEALKTELEGDPELKSMMDALHMNIRAAAGTSDQSIQNTAHLMNANPKFQDALDYSAREGAKDTEDKAERMANLYAAFLSHKLGLRIADGRIGSRFEFARNVFYYAAIAHGEISSYATHNLQDKQAARHQARVSGDDSATAMMGDESSGKAGRPSVEKLETSPASKQRVQQAMHKGGMFAGAAKVAPQRSIGAQTHTLPHDEELPADVNKPKTKGTSKAKGGYSGGMTTPSRMDSDQFESFVNERIKKLPKADQRRVFAGVSAAGLHQAIEDAKNIATGLGKTKDYNEIAKFAKYFEDRVAAVKRTRDAEADLKAEWASNLRKIRSLPIGDRKAYDMAMKKAKDPKQLDLMAKIMNKTMKAAYTLETKNIKIGKSEVTTFIRKATLPVFDRGDYEVMRMAEQAGLKAIQKQHQYGLGYGKWSTWVTFFKDLLVPFILWYNGHAEYIRPLMHLPIQKFADQLYMAYIQSPLPKFRGKRGLQMSKDDKFEMSQKMGTGSRKRIMKGWERDDILPPDRAVLHTRSYPTTKETWGKRRTKELSQRWQQAKAAPSRADDWTRGYM